MDRRGVAKNYIHVLSGCVFNADETGLYYCALPEHTYLFKNESAKGLSLIHI